MNHKTLPLCLLAMLTLIISSTVYATVSTMNGTYFEQDYTFKITCNKSRFTIPKADALGKTLIISDGKTKGSHILSFPNPNSCTQGGFCSAEIVNDRATLIPVELKDAKMTLNNVVGLDSNQKIYQTGILEQSMPGSKQVCHIQVVYSK